MAISVCAYSARRRQPGSPVTSGWVNVCTPSWWPSRTIRFAIPGLRATCVPTTKNVAGTWYFASTSRICGVHRGSGPSSKVSATVLAGIVHCALRLMIWPPLTTAAGIVFCGPPSSPRWSGTNRAFAYASTASRLITMSSRTAATMNRGRSLKRRLRLVGSSAAFALRTQRPISRPSRLPG
jgi:hypothetical protein